MTREEAITTLKEMHDSFDRIHENSDGEIGYEQMTALDMAIEALKADVVSLEVYDIIEPNKIYCSPQLAHNVEVVVRCKDCRHRDLFSCPLADNDFQKDEDFCSWGERREPTIPTFAESAEAYKAWTGEEMAKTSDEINEMNMKIIKDILKMMPTAYLLEALGVSTFEELTEPTDKPHGRLIDADKLKKQLDTVYNEMANERERKGLRLARWFLISAPTVSATKKLNNQIHLCDSCKYNYPNCPSENEDVLFGNGVGNDNICCCAKYLASADRPHGEHGEWEHTEEVTTMDGLHWHVWRCTNCNSSGNPDMNYCPNCGAKMGGDGE